jgi:hypothetical protein
MRTRLIRQPKRLVAADGAQRICVRRRKPVAWIVAATPSAPIAAQGKPQPIVGLQVRSHEDQIQRRIKAAGGQWNPTRRVWELRYDRALVLGVVDRVAQAKVSTNRISGKT